jgi:hypothetical protein
MRKFIYHSIVEKLKEITVDEIAVIKHFDMWSNNLAYTPESEAFYTPAVFIEFGDIEWRHQGRGVRDAAVTIILHVVTHRNAPSSHELPYEARALEFFDLLRKINVCLYRHAKAGELFGHDALTAVASKTDHDFYELRHDMEVFSCHAQEVLSQN